MKDFIHRNMDTIMELNGGEGFVGDKYKLKMSMKKTKTCIAITIVQP